MARRVPPLNPLHTFEVVARTGNLTTAAGQLHVTQSAVSRQITALERYFGVLLFRRERHGVTLTEAGRRYADQVVPAFAAIASATEALYRGSDSQVLRVGTYSTFAAKWLIPRLPLFQQRHPDIEVRIQRLVPEVNFERDAVDLAIQLVPLEEGRPMSPAVRADLLFAERMEPVCSPDFLAQHASPGESLATLLAQRLLVSRYHPGDWDEWLAATGRAAQAAQAGRMVFNASMLTWQAAGNGLGIAIGHIHLLQDELGTGQLLRPFGQPVDRAQGYCLLSPRASRGAAPQRVFRHWLLGVARKDIA